MTPRLPLLLGLALAILLGSLVAPSAARPARRPTRAHKRSKPKPKPTPTTPDAKPDAAPVATPPTATPAPTVEPAPTPMPAVMPVEVTPPRAPPVGVAPSVTTLPPAPPSGTLVMRPRVQAHGGFVEHMDCSACHTEAGWKLSSTAGASGFDHDRTGFPLRGSHVQAPCSRCHTGQAKPLTACEGCHRDPHQGRHDGTCAECHTATAWADTTTLEQHRRTRMPLTGRHALVDCSACHKRQGERGFAGTPTDCFACHRDDYRRAASPHKHDGSEGPAPFSRECSMCHQTSGWSPAFADPAAITRSSARIANHDAVFVLTTGSHRSVECSACHVDLRRTKLVRCDGCHLDASVRAQHRSPVARTASACLRCHPRGAAR